MYVTRPLSQLLKHPEALSTPPECPNSGYLVIQDIDFYTSSSDCFGWCVKKHVNRQVKHLPFPQNKDLSMAYYDKDIVKHVRKEVIFIPVLDQPLSSNQYYAIVARGPNKGEAVTCTDSYKPPDPKMVSQRVQIDWLSSHEFLARFVVGNRPSNFNFIPRSCWRIYGYTPDHFTLSEARGVDATLRKHLPPLNFSVSCNRSKPVIVGKWYCPFMFVKEGRLRDQVERSLYYLMTLEQRWERIFTYAKIDGDDENQENVVKVDVKLEKEDVFVAGNKASWSDKIVVDDVIWFTSCKAEGRDLSVGLRVELFEGMKWKQERGGWKGGKLGRRVKIERVEEFRGSGKRKNLSCYILVERFNLRRMDGSSAMAFDFKHFHEIRSIWE